MNQTGTAALHTPTDTVENPRTNRGVRLPSCFSSRPVLLLSTFAIGFLSGAAEGLLLGKIAVVVLQSLELLADNRLLMDQSGNYINKLDYLFRAAGLSNDHMFNIFVSFFVQAFSVSSSTLSLAVGIFLGVSSYKLVSKNGETSMETALALAGTVCLMGISAAGYVVGLALEDFLFITSNADLLMTGIISEILTMLLLLAFGFIAKLCISIITMPLIISFLSPQNTIVLFIICIMNYFLNTKLILLVPLFPIIHSIFILKRRCDFQLIIAPVPLMLIITDIFNIAGQPIIVLSSPTNTSSAVLEGMFVGVLTTQLLMVSIGMSLFVSLYRDGAVKIGATVALSGAGVLTVTERFLPVLGPGPTIGIVAGVAWTVGVSLSAAVEKTCQYGRVVDQYGYVGSLGVTVGAAVGSFLWSHAHTGLSGMFLGLCAATIPAGLKLPKVLFNLCDNIGWKSEVCLWIVITALISIWLYFTCTFAGAMIITVLLIGLLGFTVLGCVLSVGHQ